MSSLSGIRFFATLLGLGTGLFAQAQQVMLPLPSRQLVQTPGNDLFVVQMATDRRGHLWATSGNGLVCFDGQQGRTVHDPGQPAGDRYNRLAPAPDGRIWLRQIRVGRTGRLAYFDPGKRQIVCCGLGLTDNKKEIGEYRRTARKQHTHEHVYAAFFDLRLPI